MSLTGEQYLRIITTVAEGGETLNVSFYYFLFIKTSMLDSTITNHLSVCPAQRFQRGKAPDQLHGSHHRQLVRDSKAEANHKKQTKTFEEKT